MALDNKYKGLQKALEALKSLAPADQKKLLENVDRAEYLLKENNFSGEGYKFIKFVSRKLIRVNVNGYAHRFFYPFEVQVLTKDAYLLSIQGEQAHHEYKKRQRQAARMRLLGES